MRPPARPRIRFALFLVAALHAASAGAEPPAANGPGTDLLSNLSFGSRKEPVNIRAEHLDTDYRSRTFSFRGRVHVEQGDLTLDCDQLSVKLDENAKEQVREVVAVGNVKVVQGERGASGGRAVFDQEKRTVVLSEKARLRDGDTEFDADTVTCYLDDERCEGKNVIVKIPPRPDKDAAQGETR